MIKRPTLVMLAIFVIAIGGAVLFQRSQDDEALPPAPTAASDSVFSDFSSAMVAILRIEDTQGQRIVIARDEAGLWEITQPEGGETDLGRAESAVTQLLSLRTMSSLEAGPDLAIYGLNQPQYTLTLVLNGGERHQLKVGDEVPTRNGYYVQLNNNPPQAVNKFSLDPVTAMLQDPPFLPTPTPEHEDDEELPES
jgi:hypothetical protein